MTPEFPAVEVVADQPEGTEIAHDSFAVGRRGGRGGTAFRVVKGFEFVRFERAGPERLASLTVKAKRFELSVVEGGQKNPAAPDAGRGRRRWNIGLPQHAVGGADIHRRCGI